MPWSGIEDEGRRPGLGTAAFATSGVEVAGIEPVGSLVEPLVEARDLRRCERVLTGIVGRSVGFVDGVNGLE